MHGTPTGSRGTEALLEQAMVVRELGGQVLQAAGDAVKLLWRPRQLAGPPAAPWVKTHQKLSGER